MATFDVKMPKLGESVTECTITSWSVKVGDMVEEDQILFEVTSAKVGSEIPSPVDGKVKEVRFQEGDTVPVGEVVLVIDLDGEAGGEESEEAATQEPKETVENKQEEAPAKEESAAPKEAEGPLTKGDVEERWYSPVVLEKAKAAGLSKSDLDGIEGTGFEGRVSKNDVVKFIEQKKGAPAPTAQPKADKAPVPAHAAGHEANKPAPGAGKAATPKAGAKPAMPTTDDDTVIPMDPVRRIIADRMVESVQVAPHVTSVVEVDVTKLVKWREAHKEAFKKREGFNLTYMSPIVEACVNALKKYPRVNASVDGYNIIEHKRINIGMAVSLPDGNLIVPVIKHADRMNITGIAGEVSDLAAKARKNKLTPDEISGGTFTITNFGSFHNLFGTPIINQPEVAILGVGTISKKPVVVEQDGCQMIAICDILYLALSYDHRIIDGQLGGNFLYEIAQYLEKWDQE